MATHGNVISVSTKSRSDLVNITEEVLKEVKKSGIKNGQVLIYSQHTTCGVLIQEAERGLNDDLLLTLEKKIPKGAGYLHDRIDNNADSHMKTALIGNSTVIPLINGSLQLGTWQSIFLVEFDGPRKRKILVHVMGE
ncbi:MAG: secondary thiamine-phosphate synthase enzyme YjbQ [Candidatus Helarchaeales archaeon]